MTPQVLTGLISGVGGLASNLFNLGEQRRVNQQQMDFSREMWDKQGLREKEFWNMQNAYNDPAAQMQRLQNAGLNPNLVYGSGSAAQSAAPLSPKQAHGASPSAARMDLGSVVQQTMALAQMKANIARTEAETKAIESRTVNQEFDNQVKQLLGYDKFVRDGRLATERLSTNYQRELADWEVFKVAGLDAEGHVSTHGYNLSSNSPVVLAQKAGIANTIQQAENAKKLGDIRGLETVIKTFEANLTKQGISPNSPWYTKIVGDLLQRLLGVGLGDIADKVHNQFK